MQNKNHQLYDDSVKSDDIVESTHDTDSNNTYVMGIN